MIPKIIINGGYSFIYFCKSALPIEEIKERFVDGGHVLHLFQSNACHYYCKNQECVNKINIVELQKEYFKVVKCCLCGNINIEWGFFLIIHKLKKEGLLPESFVYLCCKCYRDFGKENWLEMMEYDK